MVMLKKVCIHLFNLLSCPKIYVFCCQIVMFELVVSSVWFSNVVNVNLNLGGSLLD